MVLSGCSKPKEAPAPPPPAPAPVTEPAPGVYKPKPSPTLAAIKARGWLSCGVNPGLAGFAYADDRGAWRGFDVDICRAVAAATLGDANAVRFTPVTAPDRFTALRAGKIDMLSRNTSLTLSRDAGEGVDFPAITYYDGQGFLAPKALGLASADELNGARICVQKGTASETNLADYFQARGLKHLAVVVKDTSEALARYQADECDAFTADMGALASARSLLNSPNAHVILPTVISKEPLGPVVRQDDPAWADIVRWTVVSLVAAEELGVDSKSASQLATATTDPRVRRLLGVQDNLGGVLGLKPDWAYQVITQVGAYDEVFNRNLGAGSALKLARGHNALWSAIEPGLLYAPPVR
ncbi:amino acid ABC transporter substrate-binding protein [Phenylobacterium sp.]|uniref:amino acid ABC transporter substrate-binding protein n=1 Tax=Phenylobacterium sp. TaxID=1871053 RepID=UPI00272F40B5|nr:amino acid ABC transporter substrate-binding protein [Phenylobacterium sp.]MDP1599761.1 amino acid ABC transporter substrate-binding protein [Phenylobacterium sp.]MDP3593479.1 amino acid ABC transporter substrate-binding protein [Phenylobacterium sp.]